jgi:ABC-type phosphate transport system permease subunit
MILGTLAFLALVASACLGILMLVASVVLIFFKNWRSLSGLIFCGGIFGALLGALALVVLEALLSVSFRSPLGVWLAFGAAGFGWGGLLSGGAFLAIRILGQPTRWADRQRGANA